VTVSEVPVNDAPLDNPPTPSPTPAATRKGSALAPFVAIAAWLVPGLGHLLLGRWGRALGFFVSVGGLAITGYSRAAGDYGTRFIAAAGVVNVLAIFDVLEIASGRRN
jgi:hypothetical protein